MLAVIYNTNLHEKYKRYVSICMIIFFFIISQISELRGTVIFKKILSHLAPEERLRSCSRLEDHWQHR